MSLVFGVGLVPFLTGCDTNPRKPQPAESNTPHGNGMNNRVKTASGLEYEIITEGSGESPKVGQQVTVHYTGWLNTNGEPGKKFDSSVDRGEPFVFPIARGYVIRGWDEGVITMKLGEKRRLYIRQRAVPIIAITGTVGKTTITHLTGALAQSLGKNIFVGGNIGIGMLDAVDNETINLFVLEVSSFQLEYTKRFHPTVAVLTNIFENHLDRHGTLDAYRAAKLRIFGCQTDSDYAIVPETLRVHCASLRSHVVTVGTPATADYGIDERGIVRSGDVVVPITELPPQSYGENWAYLVAIGAILGVSPRDVCTRLGAIPLPDHRCRAIATIKGVTYYDDSKATIIEATRAALQSLTASRTILLLGGVSKGVDRSRALASFPKKGIMAVPFGAEAALLHAACRANGIPSEEPCGDLETAVARAFLIAQPGDAVLLSPGGASFDLFKNYGARGKRFKEILDRLEQGCDTVGA